MLSVDSLKTNTAFAEQNRANVPILSDADRSVAEAYGVLNVRGLANRWTYFIDPAGILVHIDRMVNPSTAGADLVAHLEELNVPRVELPGEADP